MGKERAMKRFVLLGIGVLFLLVGNVRSNPLLSFYLNELLLDLTDPLGWQLEMSEQWVLEDGQYLTTLTDTSYISSYTQSGNLPVIINDNMETPLFINPDGDILQLHDPLGGVMDEIRFGNVEQPYILAPEAGLSIALRDEVVNEEQMYYRYFDASPTIGEYNDTTDSRGSLIGFVYDQDEQPLADVQITAYFSAPFQYFSKLEAVTAEDGSYTIESLARLDSLLFHKNGYGDEIVRQQIWPNTTIEMAPVILQVLNDLEGKHDIPRTPRKYALLPNYPNPFNGSTVIGYVLPFSDMVDLSIYNVKGQKIETLFSGYQKYGRHTVAWSAGNLASGIYIYRLRTSSVILQKKCLLMK